MTEGARATRTWTEGREGHTSVDQPGLFSHDAPPPGTMRLVLHTPRDRQGRCQFTTEWYGYRQGLDDWGLRAQVSFADPDEAAARLESRGWIVAIRNESA